MQLYHITVLQDMVSFGHNAIEFTGAPDTGVFHLTGEVLMHRGGGIIQSAALVEDYGVGHIRLVAGSLGINTDNIEYPENGES